MIAEAEAPSAKYVEPGSGGGATSAEQLPEVAEAGATAGKILVASNLLMDATILFSSAATCNHIPNH